MAKRAEFADEALVNRRKTGNASRCRFHHEPVARRYTLANPSDQPGTLLCIFAPGGFERRFARALAQQAGGSIPADLEALSEAERLTKAVGPPLQF